MGKLCDFCGDEGSMVYCQSDNACLCFSCDQNVHSANPISMRHSRTLVCEICNSQPATVRCVEEKISFCQNCDRVWHADADADAGAGHKRQSIKCYSGCPSAATLSKVFVLEFPFELDDDDDDDDPSCEQLLGSSSNSSITELDTISEIHLK